MSDDNLSVDLTGLYRAAQRYENAGQQIHQMSSRMKDEVHAAAHAYGNDPDGVAFAAAVARSENMFFGLLDAWEKAMKGTGLGVEWTADVLKEAEQDNIDNVSRFARGATGDSGRGPEFDGPRRGGVDGGDTGGADGGNHRRNR